jgi:hypothetical protein
LQLSCALSFAKYDSSDIFDKDGLDLRLVFGIDNMIIFGEE